MINNYTIHLKCSGKTQRFKKKSTSGKMINILVSMIKLKYDNLLN
jgi:hypothetical protein